MASSICDKVKEEIEPAPTTLTKIYKIPVDIEILQHCLTCRHYVAYQHLMTCVRPPLWKGYRPLV